jgi:hypothetical protein
MPLTGFSAFFSFNFLAHDNQLCCFEFSVFLPDYDRNGENYPPMKEKLPYFVLFWCSLQFHKSLNVSKNR